MTAEEYFKNNWPVTLEILEEKNVKEAVCSMAEYYAEYKTAQPHEKVFKPSINAVKVSALISEKFGISLHPFLHRRYIDSENVKFEMKGFDNTVYLFNGLVMEFLDPAQVIYKRDNHFFLGLETSKNENKYAIQ